ncbi:hypothetical protein SDC9_116921 [bioreactor metagenome]|uniref:Uncharacterized protein n=1 Tax=bioreactor metagenome TaxID=1076179 RepID=A0A645C3Q5_9ZZZZ
MGKRPFALQIVEHGLQSQQIAFHLGTQRAQVGRGLAGIAAHHLHIGQYCIDLGHAFARIGQQAIELLHSGLDLGHDAIRVKDLAVGARHHSVHAPEQGVGTLQHLADLLRFLVAAQHRPQNAALPLHALGQLAYFGQRSAQCRIRGGQCRHIGQHLFGGIDDLWQLCRGVATEHGPHGIRWQRRIAQHAGIGLDGGAAHQALDQREHAGLAQPVGILLGHIDQYANRAVLGQLNLAHTAYGKARESHVHAHDHALGVIGRQHQTLRGLEHSARVEQISGRTQNQYQGQRQQRGCLGAQMRDGFEAEQLLVDQLLLGHTRFAHGSILFSNSCP